MNKESAKSEEPKNYADAIDEISEILNDLENNSVDVDTLTSRVKRAKQLLSYCEKKIKSTEADIKKITAEDGQKN